MWPILSHSRPVVRRVVLATVLLAATIPLVVASVGEDPISDSSLNAYRAGWYSNVQKQKHLTCVETCQTAKAVAEHDASAVSSTKRAFVCRAPGKPSGWLYGSQFDDRAACYTVGLDLKGSYSERFMCLCVVRPGS